MIRIGPYTLPGRAVLAPMAGVTDFPFRQICRQAGAALVTAEMAASNPALRHTLKSQLRLANRDEAGPRIVQIVGTEPAQMAAAARYQVDAGAQIVDINMGCPAKKVCKKLAGSALLQDPQQVTRILRAVVAAVDVPVTLKIRTGWDLDSRNAVEIARIAEQEGVASLAVHGRSRACKFRGDAEYDTIAEVVSRVALPVFANGDIDSAQKAAQVIDYTGASGVMIGRAAQGNPWIFSKINALLDDSEESCALFTGKSLKLSEAIRRERLIINHLQLIHTFYSSCRCPAAERAGDKTGTFLFELGTKVARKHICWYFEQLKHAVAEQHHEQHDPLQQENVSRNPGRLVKPSVQVLSSSNKDSIQAASVVLETARTRFNKLDSQSAQLDFLQQFFAKLRTIGDLAA